MSSLLLSGGPKCRESPPVDPLGGSTAAGVRRQPPPASRLCGPPRLRAWLRTWLRACSVGVGATVTPEAERFGVVRVVASSRQKLSALAECALWRGVHFDAECNNEVGDYGRQGFAA